MKKDKNREPVEATKEPVADETNTTGEHEEIKRKSQALDAFLILIRDRLRISNRNKNSDKIFDDSYNLLYTALVKEFTLSDSLQDDIDEGKLTSFDKSYTDNGYVVHLSITREHK